MITIWRPELRRVSYGELAFNLTVRNDIAHF
jgi:hypothetical protein